jgi:hypothetical protein
VARAIDATAPELTRVAGLPGDPVETDDDGLVRIGPWHDGADAYQVARWRRRAEAASES